MNSESGRTTGQEGPQRRWQLQLLENREMADGPCPDFKFLRALPLRPIRRMSL